MAPPSGSLYGFLIPGSYCLLYGLGIVVTIFFTLYCHCFLPISQRTPSGQERIDLFLDSWHKVCAERMSDEQMNGWLDG